MFGLVSKRRLVKEAIAIWDYEDTSKARSKNDLYYRMGNANALDGLCHRLGVDLTKAIREIRDKEFFEEETRKKMMDGGEDGKTD